MHPVAIKRALRAILKAAAVCSLEPDRVARFLMDGGYTRTYAYALETMQDVRYNRWREMMRRIRSASTPSGSKRPA